MQSVPEESPPDPGARQEWFGMGLAVQLTLSRLVRNPGREAAGDHGLEWLVDHGYVYTRTPKGRAPIYFASLRGTKVYRAGTEDRSTS